MAAGKHIFGGAVLALALLTAGMPASAQELSLNALIDRLDRLERDLGGVQRLLAREGVPDSAYEPIEPRGAPDAEAAARQEIRIGEIQEQIRLLTGQVEEARYQVRRLSDQVGKAHADYEDRLATIEQQLAGAVTPPIAATQPPSSIAAPVASAANPPVGSASTTIVSGDPNAERYESMGSLGTISAGSTDAVPVGETAAPPNPTAEVAPTTVAAVAASPEAQYDEAYQLLQQADYVAAEGALQRFIEVHPEHTLAGNAYYWLGETYYVRNDYQAAAVAFARGYKGFPDGSKAADNLLKLGMAFAAMDKKEEACATFARLNRDQAKASALVRERLSQESQRAGCT